MTSPTQVLKSGIGPKLVPFFKTVAIYFVVLIPVEQPSVFGALLKVLPVLSLVAFVLLHGMSFGDEYFYSRRILLGLLFSVVGDVLLVWESFFIHGLAVFLLAQICYISAFGFKPLNLQAAAVIYSATTVGLAILVPNTDAPLRLGVFIYTVMLMTMVWRAVSRVRLFEELWTWTKLCSCAGGILFAFSDACIGFNHFYSPIPHAQVVIMTTYYAAQLGISLSVVDCKASYLDSLKNSRAEEEAAAAKAPLPADGNPTLAVGEGGVASANHGLSSFGCDDGKVPNFNDGVTGSGSTDTVWGATKQGLVEECGVGVEDQKAHRSSLDGDEAFISHVSDSTVSDVDIPAQRLFNSSTVGNGCSDEHNVKQRFNAKAALIQT